MATTLNAILKKQTWSGDETGRILIFSLTDNFRRTNAGRAPRPIVGQDRMAAMIQSLRDPAESAAYNRYRDLNNWLQKYYSVALLHCERFKLYATRTLVTITGALASQGRVNSEFALVNAEGRANFHEAEQKSNRTTLDECYYFAQGYNRALDMLAEHLKMPDVGLFKMDLADLSDRAAALDKLTAQLQSQLQGPALRVLKKRFPPFTPETLVIPEQNVAMARALVEDGMRAFRQQDGGFLDLLTLRST